MTPNGMDEHRTHENSDGIHEGTGDEPALDDAVIDALRRVFSRPPEEHIAQRHLAAMRSAAAEKAGGAATLGWWAGVRERATLRRNSMPALTPRWLAAGSALLLAFVMGLAAVNVLPDSAQNVVAETVSRVGVDLPDPDDDDDKGKDKDDDDDEGDVEGEDAKDHPDNHGRTVSSVAHDKSLEGCEHGQAVAAVASSKNHGNEDAPGHSDDDKCDHADDAGADDDDADDDDDDDGPGQSDFGESNGNPDFGGGS